jgi:hypothetical protein
MLTARLPSIRTSITLSAEFGAAAAADVAAPASSARFGSKAGEFTSGGKVGKAGPALDGGASRWGLGSPGAGAGLGLPDNALPGGVLLVGRFAWGGFTAQGTAGAALVLGAAPGKPGPEGPGGDGNCAQPALLKSKPRATANAARPGDKGAQPMLNIDK